MNPIFSDAPGEYDGVWFGTPEKKPVVSYEVGQKFHFKASGIEFSIVNKALESPLYTIKYRGRRTEIVIADSELRALAEEGWKEF